MDTAHEFSGIDGFLGTRASIMLDVVFLAMFVVVPVLMWSVYLVRRRKAYQRHKQLQLVLASVLLVAIVAFEVDLQWITDWQERAAPSPYFDPDAKWTGPVGRSLLVHLTFAVPTAILWVYVVVDGLRRFGRPPQPTSNSHWHRRAGWAATIGMILTAVTGWIFYLLAFVAS